MLSSCGLNRNPCTKVSYILIIAKCQHMEDEWDVKYRNFITFAMSKAIDYQFDMNKAFSFVWTRTTSMQLGLTVLC